MLLEEMLNSADHKVKFIEQVSEIIFEIIEAFCKETIKFREEIPGTCCLILEMVQYFEK